MREFLPEGALLNTPENKRYTRSIDALKTAPEGMTLEAVCVLCDGGHNLIIELADGARLMIPREEGALGIREGLTRDIALISRVYKAVCFKMCGGGDDGSFRLRGGNCPQLCVSRRAAQAEAAERYLAGLAAGDVIPAKITRLERFGAFADVGRGIVSLIPVDAVSVSRISHAAERFHPGEDIFAAVMSPWSPAEMRLTLTHRELLGTFEQNAALFAVHETVPGIVRSVEEYGIFVELAPNLAGLAELRQDAGLNRLVSVYIKAIVPQKMKVKLSVVEVLDGTAPAGGNCFRAAASRYFVKEGHISEWTYSPAECGKWVGTRFDVPDELDNSGGVT